MLCSVPHLQRRHVSLQAEATRYFNFDYRFATKSAICQRLNKVLPETYKKLFYTFNRRLRRLLKTRGVNEKTFRGYRVYAVDGSLCNTWPDPNNKKTLVKNGNKKTYNQVRINVLYECTNKQVENAKIVGAAEEDERTCFKELILGSNLGEFDIILADRGYDGWGQLVWLQSQNCKYCIRVKDYKSEGSMFSTFNFPDGEFDINLKVKLTKSQKNEYKNNPEYKIISSKTKVPGLESTADIVEVNVRVVRVQLITGEYETLFTNLPGDQFPPNAIKELYNLRWGIECAFHHFKSDLSGHVFHHKKLELVEQEIWSSFIMYNYISVTNEYLTDTWREIESKISDECRQKFNVKHDHNVRFCSTALIYRNYLFDNLQCFQVPKYRYPLNIPFLGALRVRVPIRELPKSLRDVAPGFFQSFISRPA